MNIPGRNDKGKIGSPWIMSESLFPIWPPRQESIATCLAPRCPCQKICPTKASRSLSCVSKTPISNSCIRWARARRSPSSLAAIRRAVCIMFVTRLTISRPLATVCWPAARGLVGDGKATVGVHGKSVLFLRPKDFCGTLVELEQV